MKVVVDIPDFEYERIKNMNINMCTFIEQLVKYSSEPLNKTIEKIKTDMNDNAEMHPDGDFYLRLEWIDKIIDKYNIE